MRLVAMPGKLVVGLEVMPRGLELPANRYGLLYRALMSITSCWTGVKEGNNWGGEVTKPLVGGQGRTGCCGWDCKTIWVRSGYT